jgi:hypothetical protein
MYLECFFSNYERKAEMIQVRKRPVLPGLGELSEAFQSGYDAVSTGEHEGWNVQHVPNERTIVEFLMQFRDIMNSKWASGQDGDDAARWMAGLLAGWLRRI